MTGYGSEEDELENVSDKSEDMSDYDSVDNENGKVSILIFVKLSK